MNLNISATQINIINNYRLSAFPEDRIKTLISELNVHYQKINSYAEHEISSEKINVEIIDSLSKLKEISILSPKRIEDNTYSGDYRFAVELLESVVALAQSSLENASIREQIIAFGWEMLEKIYGYSFESLKLESLAYHWLKNKELIRTQPMRGCYTRRNKDENRIKFEPTDEELEDFYQNNNQKLYEFMVFNLDGSTDLRDPFSEQHKKDFYHYFITLKYLDV